MLKLGSPLISATLCFTPGGVPAIPHAAHAPAKGSIRAARAVPRGRPPARRAILPPGLLIACPRREGPANRSPFRGRAPVRSPSTPGHRPENTPPVAEAPAARAVTPLRSGTITPAAL